MLACMCLLHIERNHSMNIFHSSSVSPSKGTASVSIWMLLGSLLPTQPMGVRLKEGRQPMSCWYTTGGSGSSLVDSASGSWNFRNWLAFSNPPKGMAHLAEQSERVTKDPVGRKACIESGLEASTCWSFSTWANPFAEWDQASQLSEWLSDFHHPSWLFPMVRRTSSLQ